MPEVAKIKGLDIRDKKIADSTAVTSVAQTDSIRMTTTNGEEVFIARDSFVDAIASVFKSNAKSSITSLFGELTESNVSSVGSINMSNLASVLSEASYYNVSDLNDATSPGFVSFNASTIGNVPDNSNGVCIVLRRNANRFYQLALANKVNAYCDLYFRAYTGSWTEWVKVPVTH